MSTLSPFQTQLASVMETLMKTAVLEISKLVDIEFEVLQSEVTRSRSEIADLRKRLKLMELQQWTALPHRHREINDDTRTNGGQTVSKSKNSTPTIIHRDEGEYRVSMDSDINQPVNMIKIEVHDVEIKGWGNSEEGTPDVNLLPIKDAVDEVPDVDKGSQEHETAKSISLQSKSNISPGKMTINQVLRLSSQTCASETDHSSFGRPQSLTVPKSIRTHGDAFSVDKRFVCTYCSKRFRCFSQLEVHQRSHTGEKPYRCTLCGKRYTQKGHLYTHQRTHTGEKPYRCLLCGKGFIQKCTLDMHLRSHTGEKPFSCTTCGKGFTKKCNLNKHLSCQSCNS
ncbi:uncharacterized protein [Misgurnus anguillicaudatus]|uniref:uncharacterized protein n=1 Tax=Misgurnus anguillicaudatus TaxID=75329 RepID=UPI003CCF0E8C